jgi:hypothetical protein
MMMDADAPVLHTHTHTQRPVNDAGYYVFFWFSPLSPPIKTPAKILLRVCAAAAAQS